MAVWVITPELLYSQYPRAAGQYFCDRFNLNIVQPRIYDLNLVPTVWIKCVDIDTFENFTAACAMR